MFILRGWEEFKTNNKKIAEEIELVCLELSACWPKATLSKKEKGEQVNIIINSHKFEKFKELIRKVPGEVIKSSLKDIDVLVLSQTLAGRAITRGEKFRKQ